mmetsp:Transcript_1652/g.1966  ORF Transcript_1652/g.1966 Transcript_1652/m.1966 type:complete len:267 (+) Transcript_1652:441-1241(+)
MYIQPTVNIDYIEKISDEALPLSLRRKKKMERRHQSQLYKSASSNNNGALYESNGVINQAYDIYQQDQPQKSPSSSFRDNGRRSSTVNNTQSSYVIPCQRKTPEASHSNSAATPIVLDDPSTITGQNNMLVHVGKSDLWYRTRQSNSTNSICRNMASATTIVRNDICGGSGVGVGGINIVSDLAQKQDNNNTPATGKNLSRPKGSKNKLSNAKSSFKSSSATKEKKISSKNKKGRKKYSYKYKVRSFVSSKGKGGKGRVKKNVSSS